ncbi:hypothetical protein [Carnobacterium sp. ISL-102]|uniref:hypothetical protein n=1 Tax=Carnobacterium sp. ISL-102 TaxID=2819142 RepID=UPI001BE662EC|nr:hypothetical protein [Carnobacterium sp. ISL-102]MBT2731651.1 hypothetical protein [Carnobacterium sp. ISL-102]
MTKEIMQELNKIDEELQAILKEGNKKLEAHLQEVETAKANEKEARMAVIKAKKDAKASVFAKANQDFRDAKDVAEFYLDKIDEIKDNPYISKEEHKAYSTRIKSSLDKLNHSKKLRAGELLKELAEIQEEVAPVLQKGQEILHNLQHDILKDNAETTTAKGVKVHLDNLEDKYQDYTLVQWIEYIYRQYQSQQLINYTNERGNK